MIGTTAAISCAFFATAKDLISKRLSTRISPALSAFASFAYTMPLYILLLALISRREEWEALFTPHTLAIVFLRSVSDAFAESFKMHALAYTEVSTVSSLVALSPLFLLFLSPLIVGDTANFPGSVAVLLIVGGSIFFIRSGASSENRNNHKKGIIFAIGASFCFALNTCFDKLATLSVGPVMSGWAVTIGAGLLLAPSLLRHKGVVTQLSQCNLSLAYRGVFEVCFMVTKLIALQYLIAPYVVALQRSSAILTVLGGGIFFKEKDLLRKLLASAFVVAGIVLIVFRG